MEAKNLQVKLFSIIYYKGIASEKFYIKGVFIIEYFTLANFYNPYTLNIFTDTSTIKVGKRKKPIWVSGFGALAINGDNIIEAVTRINTDCPINKGEIRGIKLGICLALKYNQFSNINIFSDSQISVLGIRDRIFNYVSGCRNHEMVLYKKVGGSINIMQNQDDYLEIIDLVIRNQLRINFWHVKAHVNTRNYKDLEMAARVFQSSNNIRDSVDINLINYISCNNNKIDSICKKALNERDKSDYIFSPISFKANYFNQSIQKYKNYINKSGGVMYGS